jgi:hypothetical protein
MICLFICWIIGCTFYLGDAGGCGNWSPPGSYFVLFRTRGQHSQRELAAKVDFGQTFAEKNNVGCCHGEIDFELGGGKLACWGLVFCICLFFCISPPIPSLVVFLFCFHSFFRSLVSPHSFEDVWIEAVRVSNWRSRSRYRFILVLISFSFWKRLAAISWETVRDRFGCSALSSGSFYFVNFVHFFLLFLFIPSIFFPPPSSLSKDSVLTSFFFSAFPYVYWVSSRLRQFQ